MEYIYFARPDSDIDKINVHASRKACGRELARQDNVQADIVVGVPDSSLSAFRVMLRRAGCLMRWD